MKTTVKALLCENEILEQLMSIPINEILSYSSKSDSVDPEEALRYLAEMYIDNCGVSTGLRSFADYCSVYWIRRLKQDENKGTDPKYHDLDTLPELLPLLSDNYTTEIDDYDIIFMTDAELRDILIDQLREVSDEKIKIILCAGICDILHHMSSDSWLKNYKMDKIEDAIVNLKDKTLIEYRCSTDIAKYIPRPKISDREIKSERLKKKLEEPPHPFSDGEIHHFEQLNARLVELQHEVMDQVRDITLNLKEQIANGFHQYDSFYIEGLISIDDYKDDVDSLINILAEHAKYTVINSNYEYTKESLDERIAMENHWYGNWHGIYNQLETEHGLKVCRAFCQMFEDARAFTIADIMKITPDMFIPQVKIYI
ncbi:MAG: hypothetical protein K2N91_08405 [Muribaculaceae bacterium]|nr:hypothetical protein [Muribaculaceae bacterium]